MNIELLHSIIENNFQVPNGAGKSYATAVLAVQSMELADIQSCILVSDYNAKVHMIRLLVTVAADLGYKVLDANINGVILDIGYVLVKAQDKKDDSTENDDCNLFLDNFGFIR